MATRDDNLLDVLMEERIHKGLEKALNDNELYKSAQKEVDEAINELEKAGFSREQNKVVDKAISAANASGAAYGATAYRQGFNDGIKLISKKSFIICVEETEYYDYFRTNKSIMC